MLDYFKESFQRKAARRRFKAYNHTVTEYNFPEVGEFKYANWDNPLSMGKVIKHDEIIHFKKFIKKGDLAVDIGANIGDTTVPMGLAAGKEGLVLGFECNPVVFKVLEVNEKLNLDKANIKAIPYAISETEDEFYYNSSEASLSNGGIAKTKKNSHGKFGLDIKVKSVNLKYYLESHYPDWISKLSFIKIDTEGHDLIIIKSIVSLLSEIRPVINAECFKDAGREEREEIFKLFDDLDYRLYHIDVFENESKTAPLEIDDFYNMKHFDFLALPKQ